MDFRKIAKEKVIKLYKENKRNIENFILEAILVDFFVIGYLFSSHFFFGSTIDSVKALFVCVAVGFIFIILAGALLILFPKACEKVKNIHKKRYCVKRR